MIKLGFTGTQRGMTYYQRSALSLYLQLKFEPGAEFHNGCCVGADEEASLIAKGIGYRIVGHPPVNQYKMNGITYDELWPPLDFLIRNKNIVNIGHELLAAPQTDNEVLRSGTWATIRHCRKTWPEKHIEMFYPWGDDE